MSAAFGQALNVIALARHLANGAHNLTPDFVGEDIMALFVTNVEAVFKEVIQGQVGFALLEPYPHLESSPGPTEVPRIRGHQRKIHTSAGPRSMVAFLEVLFPNMLVICVAVRVEWCN